MSKHTPGPWRVWEVSEEHWNICETEDRARHSHFASVSVGNCWWDEGKANARLIAAAPELLEALKLLHDETADYVRVNNLGDPWHNQSMKLARAAIAKAEIE